MANLTKFSRRAGVEFTRYRPWRIPDMIPAKEMGRIQKLGYFYREDAINDWFQKHYGHQMAHCDTEGSRLYVKNKDVVLRFGTDPYCYEIASTKLRNWAQLKKFFTLCDDFCDKWKLLRFSDYVCGAGGHIHISITGVEAAKVQRLMLANPWAMYAFADPRDDQHPLMNLLKSVIASNKRHGYEDVYTQRSAYDAKHGPIAYREYYGTVEFRMMDVAQTWEQQEEQMAFAQAFVRYAVSNPAPEKLLTKSEVNRLTESQCQDGFKQLIADLGLPWDRYESYTLSITNRLKWKVANF